MKLLALVAALATAGCQFSVGAVDTRQPSAPADDGGAALDLAKPPSMQMPLPLPPKPIDCRAAGCSDGDVCTQVNQQYSCVPSGGGGAE